MSDWGGLKPDDGSREKQKRARRDEDKLYCDCKEDGELCNESFVAGPALTAHIENDHESNERPDTIDEVLTCYKCFRKLYFASDDMEKNCLCGNTVERGVMDEG